VSESMLPSGPTASSADVTLSGLHDNARMTTTNPFLASGPDKAPILHDILENSAAGLPSQRVRPTNGKLIWLVDEAAASKLSRRSA